MGDFIEERYKSKDEIKRNERLFLRREHYDNDNKTNVKYDKKDFIKEEVSCIMYIRKLLSNDNEGRELHGYSDSGRTYRRCGY